MTALPSAFFAHVSIAWCSVWPRYWIAKSTIEVVPPKAAAHRAGLEVVGRRRAAKRHVHVGVHVDAAGQHVLAGGVDHLVGLHVERRADDGDLLVLDQHVALVLIDRGDDGAVLDQCSHRLTTGPRKLEASRRRTKKNAFQYAFFFVRFVLSCLHGCSSGSRTTARSSPSCRCRTRSPSRPWALRSPKKLSFAPPNGKYAIGAATPMLTPTIDAVACLRTRAPPCRST